MSTDPLYSCQVISDNEAREADEIFIRSQLAHRVEMDDTRIKLGPSLGEKLQLFQDSFDEDHTAVLRWWRAFADLARGQALCFVDARACFLVGILEVCRVPVSRERLERLVPWFEKEVCRPPALRPSSFFAFLGIDVAFGRNEGVAGGQLSVLEIFKALNIPAPKGLRGTSSPALGRIGTSSPKLGRIGAVESANDIELSVSKD